MNREQKIALMHTKKIKKIMKETIQYTKECEQEEFLKKQLKKIEELIGLINISVISSTY